MNAETTDGRQLVWDLPTRVFHWTLAASFMGAYVLSESERLRAVHVMFGYTVLGLVAFRLVWGLVGSRYARFATFAFGPGKALAYLRDLATRRAPDYTGHNPAGSWAIYLLLGLALATGVTGWLNLEKVGGDAMEEVHEVLANAWLAVVFIHVAGVIVGSLAHRRNLVATMLTGWRRGGEGAPGGARSAIGISVAAAVVAFWTWSLMGGGMAPATIGDAAAGVTSGEHDDHDGDAEDDD